MVFFQSNRRMRRLRRIARILLINQKYLVYGVFLLIATLLWVVNKLSNSYTHDVPTVVELSTANPLEYTITEGNSTPATLRLHGRGYQLLFYLWFSSKRTKIIVSSALPNTTKSSTVYLPSKQLHNIIAQQLSNSLDLQTIFPDTLSYVLTARQVKKVPVRSNIKLSYAPQYMPNGVIQLNPDSVLIGGAVTDIESINEIFTQALTKENVSRVLQEKIALVIPPKVSLSHHEVDYSIEVQRFVEIASSVDVLPLNFPDSLSVQFLPAQVSLVLSVKMEDYKALKHEKLKVVADYASLSNSLSKQLQVRLLYPSKYALSSSIKPSFVEAIIKKKI
ncbi:MAG: hypothetical protein ACRCZB_06370 [Bacteroidales bacterium]